MKICSIGCGSAANKFHGPSLRKCAAADSTLFLAACCDLDSGKAEQFRREFGFAKHYTDFVEMLNAENPDAVFLLVPPQITSRMAVKLLEWKIPLFMEKPPGCTKEESLAILRATDKGGILHQVAFNRRHTPLIRYLKGILGRELSGAAAVQNIRCDFYRTRRIEPDFTTTAVHGIDTVKYVADSEYKQIRFSYQELPQYGPNVANVFLDCIFESGATAQLSFCPVSGVTIERLTVNGYDHTLFVHLPVFKAMDAPGRLVHVERGKIKLDISGDQCEIFDGSEVFEEFGFYDEIHSFLSDIKCGKHPVDNMKTAIQSVEIMESMRNRANEWVAGG